MLASNLKLSDNWFTSFIFKTLEELIDKRIKDDG